MKEKATIDKALRYIKRKTKTTEDGKKVVGRLHAKLAAEAIRKANCLYKGILIKSLGI